jgi:glycosyltransferase involved in cell wall biosynthesis
MENTRPPRPRRIAFITTNRVWGGSEELWSATAAALAEDGHDVTVFKGEMGEDGGRLRRLRERGCRIVELDWLPLMPRPLFSFLAKLWFTFLILVRRFQLRIRFASSRRHDLIVFSQGLNFDCAQLGRVIFRTRTPYVLIQQKASDMDWPHDLQLPDLREIYRGASACYFVSEHNLRLTEEQLGMELPQASVVRNPFLVPWKRRDDWPSTADGWRLTCVGRMYAKEKGQDMLLRVLARTKWRNRPLSVTFYGEGVNRDALESLAGFYSLSSVFFGGFTNDPAAIWNDHHGLILASRCEGLPLVIVEAMLSGRVPIVTDVAGNSEVIEDDRTGFLAKAPTEDAIDEALERAWQRRSDWRGIGAAAGESIRTLVPPDPARELAATLLATAPESRATRSSSRRSSKTLRPAAR